MDLLPLISKANKLLLETELVAHENCTSCSLKPAHQTYSTNNH